MSTGTRLVTIPYPLRHDFIASVQIPRDMSVWEAKRLAAMVLTLGIPIPDRKLLTSGLTPTDSEAPR